MGVKNPRVYTKDFKIEAVALIRETGSLTAVSKRLGVPVPTLHTWKKQFGTRGQEAFPGRGKLPASDAETEALRKENQQLKRDIEILKKAAAYFSSLQR